jgi:hypothetical protein
VTVIQNTNDLLGFLIAQAETRKDWFGFTQQRLTAVSLAHEIAKNHANTMSPEEVVDFAVRVNDSIYQHIIKPR